MDGDVTRTADGGGARILEAGVGVVLVAGFTRLLMQGKEGELLMQGKQVHADGIMEWNYGRQSSETLPLILDENRGRRTRKKTERLRRERVERRDY